MKPILFSTMAAATLSLAACADGPIDAGSQTQRAAIGATESAALDTPAASEFQKVRGAFKGASASSLKYAVYDLGAPTASASVKARAAVLGFSNASKAKAGPNARYPMAVVEEGTSRLSINDTSGTEFFVNTDRFHKDKEVPESTLLADSDYIARARQHVAAKLPADVAGAALYPYKVRKYYNAASNGNGIQSYGVYQVAVALNQSIGNVPVIGPGGKTVVHMATDGAVLAHENMVRVPSRKVADVAGTDLIAPDDAQSAIEATLTGRGVDLSKFTLSRSEFGYFRYGRNSVQQLLAPHYAFFYSPKPGVSSKILVEFTPAVKAGALRTQIDADRQAEDARKQTIIADGHQEPATRDRKSVV